MNNGATTPGGLPPGWNTATPYDASLQYISVFGALQSKPTTADCSDAPINKTTLVPNGVNIDAQAHRWRRTEATVGTCIASKSIRPGFMTKTIGLRPAPNNYETATA